MGSDPLFSNGLCRVERRTYTSTCRNQESRTHAFSVLVFHMTGKVDVEHNGSATLRGGDVHLVPAGDPHRVVAAHRADTWTLAFCQTCLPLDRFRTVLAPIERVRAGGVPVVSLPSERQNHVVALLEELEREQRRGPAAAPLVVESLLGLVLNEVARAAPTTVTSRTFAGSLVADVLSLVEAHCLEPLTLNEIAAAVRRTPAHVTTAVKKATGRTVVEWIQEGRLAEARRRLRDTDELVEIIAERVGYADPSHFVRLFRSRHGMAPAAWRRAQRAGGEGAGGEGPA